MYDLESAAEVWPRLRAYLERHPPQPGWEQLHGYHYYPVACPPATAGQLSAAEERLGTALPEDLRRLYTEVANGGYALGPVITFYSATPNLAYGFGYWDTIVGHDELIDRPEPWSLHPRIADALLRHRDRFVLVDSPPASVISVGDAGCGIDIQLDVRTGQVYSYKYWGEITPADGAEQILCTCKAEAPSLGAWFARWLDEREANRPYERVYLRQLTADLVETDDLADPDVVWRGIYRLEPM